MAKRHVCNVHQGIIPSSEFHVVELTRATLAGEGRSTGLETDAKIEAEVCDECWALLQLLLADAEVFGYEEFRDRALAAAAATELVDGFEREDAAAAA